jgi:hypothetical protein
MKESFSQPTWRGGIIVSESTLSVSRALVIHEILGFSEAAATGVVAPITSNP